MQTNKIKKTAILYLDTQLEFAKIFSRLLESANHKVTHYSNLEQVCENQTNHDLVFCEFKLFKHRLFSDLRTQILYQKPCLIFSTHLSNQDKLLLHRQGIAYYFERTENFKAILDKMNLALQV
ncbi:hypothetical protein MRY82_00765 [bacterium]|nr:hypothetical protein [bacterium]